jgi:hypothetical protein
MATRNTCVRCTWWFTPVILVIQGAEIRRVILRPAWAKSLQDPTSRKEGKKEGRKKERKRKEGKRQIHETQLWFSKLFVLFIHKGQGDVRCLHKRIYWI